MVKNWSTVPGNTPIQDGDTIRVKTDGSGWESHLFLNTSDVSTAGLSGQYSDLTGKPTIPSSQVNTDWNSVSGVNQLLNKPTLATVATSGSYNDLTSKPTIPAAQVSSDWNSSSGVSQILNKPTITKFISLSGTTTGGNITFNVSPASFTALTRGGCLIKVDDSDKAYGYEITSFSNTSVTVNVKEQVFSGVVVLSITVLGSVSMNNVANGTTVYASFIGV